MIFKNRLLYGFIFCISGIFGSLQAQDKAEVDSLLLVLRASENDTHKVNILNRLSKISGDILPKKSIEYAQQALNLAQKKTYYQGQAQAYNNLGDAHESLGNFAQAMQFQKQALALYEQHKNTQEYAYTLVKIGSIYQDRGFYDKAMEHYLKVVEWKQFAQMQAIKAMALNQIGKIYQQQGKLNQALKQLMTALQINQKLNLAIPVAENLNNVGLVYDQKGNYYKALEYLEKSLSITRKLNNEKDISVSLMTIGDVYMKLNQLEEALNYQQEALKIEESIGEKPQKVQALLNIARIYQKQNKAEKTQEYAQKSFQLAQKLGLKAEILDASYFLFQIYQQKKDFKTALGYHQLYTTYKDSLFNAQSTDKIDQLKFAYELEKEEDKMKVIQTLQKSQNRYKNTIIMAICIVLLIATISAIVLFQNNRLLVWRKLEIKSKNKELEERSSELSEVNAEITALNEKLEEAVKQRTQELEQAYRDLKQNSKELDTFLYRSSHDLRRPLTSLMGLAQISEFTVHDSDAKNLFNKVDDTARTMDKMLTKLMMVSDINEESLEVGRISFRKMIQNIEKRLADKIESKEIDITTKIETGIQYKSNDTLIHAVLVNLIENAVVFCSPVSPYISIHIAQDEDNILITVKDNGTGIHKDYQDRIFEMYFRGSERAIGNGLGLYVVRRALEKLKGTIHFESEYGKGSTFEVVLPKNLPIKNGKLVVENLN
jgi:signal transduction histidine kinase/Tfp pilus assembly protein PilF